MEIDVMIDRWLSVEEIAEYLGVSKDTVPMVRANRSICEVMPFGSV